MVEEEAIPRPDPKALAHAVQLAERQVATQLQMSDARLRKLENLARIGVLELAGVLAIVGLMLNAGVRPSMATLIGFGSGVLANLLGLYAFLQALAGIPRPFRLIIGPDIDHMYDEFRTTHPDETTHHVEVLEAFARAFQHNERVDDRLDAKASGGTSWLLFSALIQLATIAYILPEVIHV